MFTFTWVKEEKNGFQGLWRMNAGTEYGKISAS